MAEFSLGTAALGTAIDLAGLRHGQDQAHKETQGWLSGLQGSAAKGFGGLQKAVGAGLLGGLGLVTAGFSGLAVAFSDSVDLARIQEDAEKQLAAVLASTGEAAGLTAAEVKGMAKELQGVTNFGDEAILTGQNLLLTFTGIGEDVFPRATETMLDMATALGTDAKGSAIQLGKALNDPIAGISALSRVGVSFTEQQKEQIKALQESGDLMGAQTIILDELAKEFGGSARALVDPADQMKNAWNGLKETIGAGLLPVIEGLYEKALPLVNQAIEKATGFISSFTGALSSGLNPIGALKTALYDTFGEASMPILTVIDTVHNLIRAFGVLWSGEGVFEDDPAWMQALVKIHDTIAPIIEIVTNAIAQFVSWKDILIALGIVVASIVIPILWGIVAAAAPVIAVAAALVGAVALVRNAWENDWGGIRTALVTWWTDTGKPIFDQLRVWLAQNLPQALATLRQWWEEKLLPSIRTVWAFIQENLIPLFAVLIDVWFAAIRVQIAVLQAAWEYVLLPALRVVWEFIQNYIIPIFDGMGGSIGSVVGVIQDVIGWLGRLADKFNNLADNIPAWLIPGSPTPFEIGLRGVADAMRQTSRAGDVLGGSMAMRGLVGVAAGGASATVNQSFYGATDPQLVGRSSRQGVVEAMRRTGRG